MDHSVNAYLERRSNEELIGFLYSCMYLHSWAQYMQFIPDIFTILQKRNEPIPEHIQSAWDAFLVELELDNDK